MGCCKGRETITPSYRIQSRLDTSPNPETHYLRSTVFERLAAEFQVERLKQAAVVRQQNRDYCCEKRQRKRNAAWNVQACNDASEETDATKQLWEQSNLAYGYVSQLHPEFWKYHVAQIDHVIS